MRPGGRASALRSVQNSAQFGVKLTILHAHHLIFFFRLRTLCVGDMHICLHGGQEPTCGENTRHIKEHVKACRLPVFLLTRLYTCVAGTEPFVTSACAIPNPPSHRAVTSAFCIRSTEPVFSAEKKANFQHLPEYAGQACNEPMSLPLSVDCAQGNELGESKRLGEMCPSTCLRLASSLA